jgi:hypothetical protein
MVRIVCLSIVVLVAGCGSVKRPFKEDAGVKDDAAIDAAIDAPPPDALLSPPSQEITGGAGRAAGPTYTIDVQLGHPVSQQPASGTTYRLEGNAAIKP